MSKQTELVHVNGDEYVRKPNQNDAVVPAEFHLFRMPYKARQPKASKPKAKAKNKVSNGPGRPRVYKGLQRIHIAHKIRKNGLLRTQQILAAKGAEVSMTLLRAIAQENRIKFSRGRRPAAA